MKIINRLKKNESTLCVYTECGNEIKEGHILGYGDNYPCVVLYNRFEAKFQAIEFGYDDDEYLCRYHDITSYTVKWKILGSVDNNSSLLKTSLKKYEFNKDLEQFYK